MAKKTQQEAQPAVPNDLVEVWKDTVSIRDLLISILICLVLGFGGYLLSPLGRPYPLIFGLVGTIVGFMLVSFIFKAKRVTNIKEE